MHHTMKHLLIIFTITCTGLFHSALASEPTRTIIFQYEPTLGKAVFTKINGHLNNKFSEATMLLKLPDGELRLLEVRSFHAGDPTFVTVAIHDPKVLINTGNSVEPLLIFSARVKVDDGEPYEVIETSEGVYSLTISWRDTKPGSNKTE